MPDRSWQAWYAEIDTQSSQAIVHFWNGREMGWPAVVILAEDQNGAAMAYRYTKDHEFAGDTWHEGREEAKYALNAEYGSALGQWIEIPRDISFADFDRYVFEPRREEP